MSGDGLPDVATPTLLVDIEKLDANLSQMAAVAHADRVALRPHAKTHKCLEIARRQMEHGARGLTVATVSEAEVFARAGFDDLFLAYPVYVTTGVAGRLRRLLDIATVAIGVDSLESARALVERLDEPHRGRIGVLVEVDSGQHRSGVRPDEAGALAERLASSGLSVRGVFTFPGHSYAPDGRLRAAQDEAAALATATASMTERGLAPAVVSGGSTPSVGLVHDGKQTEIRPGVYVFGDAQQWELGTIGSDAVALTCLATVVSHAGGNLVLDSGSKALGADRSAWATGYGRLLDQPDARITALSEHHAVVAWPADTARPGVGTRVRVVPNHVCNAVNLADTLAVVREGELLDRWAVAARGANT